MNPWLIGDDLALLRPLWLGAALVLLLIAIVWPHRSGDSGWRRILSPAVLAFLGGAGTGEAGGRPRIDIVLLLAALIALSLSAPATRRDSDDTWRQSVGWVALVDVSRSMSLDDVVPSRLAAAREAVLTLSRAAGARPMALILYAGDAFLMAPPAFDRTLLDEQATLLEYGIVPVDGSNLSRALSLATNVIDSSEFAHARLFVLADSGGIGADSHAAVRHLADRGHRVDVLHFGLRTDDDEPDVSPSPGDDDALLIESLAERADAGTSGAVDVAASERLARDGGGVMIQSDAFGAIDTARLKLARDRQPASVAGLQSVLWHDRSHWLLLVALPLLLRLFVRHGAR